MNRDKTATKIRRMLAEWLRPDSEIVMTSPSLIIFFNRVRDAIHFAQFSGAITPACASVLYCHSFEAQRVATVLSATCVEQTTEAVDKE